MATNSTDESATTAVTATQRAYAHVRDCILSGRFTSGEKLSELTIAKQLGVSRTPVREAFRNLSADGFIVLKTHVGAVVRPWNFEELYSSFVIRGDIEAQAAAQAARRITAEEITELSTLCDLMEQADHPGDAIDAQSRSTLNRRLHVRILQISGLAHAERTATQLMDLAVLTMTFNQFDAEEVRRSNSDHRVLLRAFRLRDDLLAHAIMRAHILTAAGTLREKQPVGS